MKNIYGFAGIKTNANTASAMNELNLICTKLNHPNYCVITDFSAFWATHWNKNPLKFDRSVNAEMFGKNYWNDISTNKSIQYIIAEKYEPEFLSDSLVLISSRDKNRTLIDSLNLHCIKKLEGKYFSVFTKPKF